MAKLLKLRRGTTTQHGSFTGAEGEVTVDTDKEVLVVHDGSTAGGHPVAAEDMANVSSASITGRLGTGSIVTAKIADQAITLDKLPHGTSSNNGKFLRANNGADPTFEVVNTDLVADTSPQLGGNLASNGNRVVMADDDQINLGTGNDFNLFHESSSNFNVIRQNNALSTKWLAGGDTVARFMTNAAVELYYDNSKKFETTSTGATLSGVLVSNGLELADNKTVSFGTGLDLKIYHNGSNSYIDNATGLLYLRGADNYITNSDGTETLARFAANAQVELYHNNTKRFETISDGAKVTGRLQVTNYLEFDDDVEAYWGNSHDLQIDHSGGVNRILTNGPNLKFGTTGETQAMFNNNAGVELYYDNTKRFETNSGGAEVFGHLKLDDSKYLKLGNSSGTADVQIYHNGSNFHVQHTNAGSAYIDSVGDHNFRHSSTSEYRAAFKNNGAVDLYYDNSKKFETTSAGVTIVGTLTVGQTSSSDIYMYDSDETTRRIHTNSGRIGFLNSSNDWSAYSVNSGDFYVKGDLLPDGTHDIGSTGARWQNIYTNDLHLSNEGHSNDIDGSWGNWTIQEGESDLFLKNNRSGKKYKFNLTEVS